VASSVPPFAPELYSWSPDSWRTKPNQQPIPYEDPIALEKSTETLRKLPPLVTSWEIERLRSQIADAQEGSRFLLQGGDCAETLDDCTPSIITNKLKILLQMSLVLVHALQAPVIRVGRFAGQYTKPRSSPMEEIGSLKLPSYFGDSVNGAPFDPVQRRPDPYRMVRAYKHAALTLNFIRSLTAAGFADVHHPEYWDLGYRASVPENIRSEYRRTTETLADAVRFMSALGERTVAELTRVEFFTSHEALLLEYESAQTTTVPRRSGHYLLSTHYPWVGERTRDPNAAHIEFLRGIRNPIGIKVGPTTSGETLVETLRILDPSNEPGKISVITRLGAAKVRERLPGIVQAVQRAGRRVLWVVDPMHGNTHKTSTGRKTRHFDDILQEIDLAFEVHDQVGTQLGGVHFELTGDDVTECTGGAEDIQESDLDTNYSTLCDPRLNYRQALEMSFFVARRLARRRRSTTVFPPSSRDPNSGPIRRG
jgi:3-deoxy-7-phosphoheptulonate synthase